MTDSKEKSDGKCNSRIYTKVKGKRAFVRLKATLEKSLGEQLENHEALEKAEEKVEQQVNG